MATNPISLHHSGRITPSQLQAFNTLLTQLAALVDTLGVLVTSIETGQAESKLSSADSAVVDYLNTLNSQSQSASERLLFAKKTALNWQCLLKDLKTVVLPEFYVVFNDPTTLAMARRQLYDLTQAIYFTLQRFRDASFAGHSETTGEAATTATSSILNNKYLTSATIAPDSYVTAAGNNGKLAAALLDLSRFIAVDGVTYIEQFEPYYTQLVELKTLESFLQSHSQLTLIAQLETWQRARLSAFSLIQPQKSSQDFYIINNKIDHPLAKWAICAVDGQPYLPKAMPASTGEQSRDLITDSDNPLVLRPQQFRMGFTLSTLGLGFLIIGGVASVALVTLLGAVLTFTGMKQVLPTINFHGQYEKIKLMTTQAMVVSFLIMIMGTPLTPIALVVFAAMLWLKVANNTQHSVGLNSTVAIEEHRQQMLGEVEATRIAPEDEAIAPINFDQHAYYLGALLSEGPTERLKQLVTAINELRAYQGYLQQTYPYLATRVQELGKDLTDNTIIRLNELASRFVKDDQVSAEVRALFVRQHESRIDALIGLNLKQVKDLNKTILEQQMAVFSDVGSEQERQFRDAVMELKILLRWLIAQQPDELQASSHQAILGSLESSTLKDMQTVFFANQTSSEQRQALLEQVQMLIEHFKQQSPYSLDINSGQVDSAAQEAKIDTLLKLSPVKDGPLSEAAAGKTEEQAKAQQFVDFNKAYVAELIKYWH